MLLDKITSISVSGVAQFILIMLLLGNFNRLTEALKWHILMCEDDRISFKSSYYTVLTGMSLGFVTPARSGEIAARIWYSGKGKYVMAVSKVISAGTFQTLVTLVFGLSGLLLLKYYTTGNLFNIMLLTVVYYAAIVILIIILLLIIFPVWFNRFFHHVPFAGNWLIRNNIVILKHNIKTNLLILFFSFLRHVVFNMQFLYVFYFLGSEMDLLLQMALINVFFLLSMLIPTSFFGKLGIREGLLLLLFLPYETSPSFVVGASLIIWFFNQVIPAITGSFLLLFFAPKNHVSA